jgi:hypothetical protein
MTAATGFEYNWAFAVDVPPHRKPRMIRWVLTIFIGLIVFSALLPWLEKLGVGRLPGDVSFSLFGKRIFLPFASTILLSTVIFLVARFL